MNGILSRFKLKRPEFKKFEKIKIPKLKKFDFGRSESKKPKLLNFGFEKLRESALSYTRFSVKEQTHFAKRLAFLVNAGVPIVESLHMLRKQTKGRAKGKIYERIIVSVTDGMTLSDSLAKFDRFFGSFAINIVKIGETGGVLSQNLEYLADELQKKYELRKKVIGALVYPVFIASATLILVGLLTVFIFPKIMPIFQSLSVELPFTTLALLALSNFLQAYWLYVILGIVAFIIIFKQLHRRVMPFHFLIDVLILKLPIVGRMTKSYYTANFCRTLGMLLKSGIGVVEAVSITGDTLGSLVYQRECKIMSKKVMRGEKLSTHLEAHQRFFPDIIGNMVAIGEASGKLSDTLIYLSEMYEAEVNDLTKNLSNSIEPVLMIFMGIVVGFVAVSVITPIYEVTQNISNQI